MRSFDERTNWSCKVLIVALLLSLRSAMLLAETPDDRYVRIGPTVKESVLVHVDTRHATIRMADSMEKLPAASTIKCTKREDSGDGCVSLHAPEFGLPLAVTKKKGVPEVRIRGLTVVKAGDGRTALELYAINDMVDAGGNTWSYTYGFSSDCKLAVSAKDAVLIETVAANVVPDLHLNRGLVRTDRKQRRMPLSVYLVADNHYFTSIAKNGKEVSGHLQVLSPDGKTVDSLSEPISKLGNCLANVDPAGGKHAISFQMELMNGRFQKTLDVQTDNSLYVKIGPRPDKALLLNVDVDHACLRFVDPAGAFAKASPIDFSQQHAVGGAELDVTLTKFVLPLLRSLPQGTPPVEISNLWTYWFDDGDGPDVKMDVTTRMVDDEGVEWTYLCSEGWRLFTSSADSDVSFVQTLDEGVAADLAVKTELSKEERKVGIGVGLILVGDAGSDDLKNPSILRGGKPANAHVQVMDPGGKVIADVYRPLKDFGFT